MMNQKKTSKKPSPLEKKIEALEAELEKAQADAESAKASSLRSLADLENFRRRLTADQARWSEQAVKEFLKKMMPSFLELSLGASHSQDESMQQVVEKFFEHLKQQGVEAISPVAGDAIDPDKHEVLMAEQGEAGTVVRCLEMGWQFKDHVIQPAKVSGAQN